MLELNDVLLKGEPQTVSLIAFDAQMACIAGGTAGQLTKWLYGILGFVPVVGGYISIDGEPLTPRSAFEFRQLMSFVPSNLLTEGQIRRYEPPTVEDVIDLKANRQLMVTTGQLNREIKQMGNGVDYQATWLALAVLRNKPILLVDNPLPAYYDYLRLQAERGHVVIVASNEDVYRSQADAMVNIINN